MKRKKTGNKLPPFVPLLWDTLNHRAYKALPPHAAKLLPYFIGKVKINPRESAYHNETFSFTYREAQNYGCSKRTFYNVVTALVKYGFIDPVRRGGLKGLNMTASIFKLSGRWKDYGNASFVEMNWATFGMHQIEKMVIEGTR
jgi:hypothetical protein